MQAELLEQYEYLIALRDSGVTNMFGAGSFLEEQFGLPRAEARGILASWMESFNLPKDEQPKDGR